MAGTDITSASGVRLHVEIDGPADGAPVLVLHGITGCAATWDWLVPIIAETHRMVRLDFRGHGDSDRTPGAYSSEGYVSDATAVCEALFDGPCAVIGHSLGGVTALGLAQTRPDLVDAMVLEDPPMGIERGNRQLEGNSLLDAFRMMRHSVPALQASGIDLASMTPMLAQTPSAVGSDVRCDAPRRRRGGDGIRAAASRCDRARPRDRRHGDDLGVRRRPAAHSARRAGGCRSDVTRLCVPTGDDRAGRAPRGSVLDVRTPAGGGHLLHDSRATATTSLARCATCSV